MILHVTEMAVTLLLIAVDLQEVVFGQFKYNSKENQELSNDLVMNMARKMFDLPSILVHNARLSPLKRGNKFRDVEYFSLVKLTRGKLLHMVISKISFLYGLGSNSHANPSVCSHCSLLFQALPDISTSLPAEG